jgi:molybdopterin-guanine dinucleotide biosynthesis protein A
MGSDKAGVELDGRRLLDWLLDSIPADTRVVLVGPDPSALRRPVAVTREDPPGSGPVAGIAAGLGVVATALVAIVAVDMPLAGPSLPRLVDLLAQADDNVDAVLPMDASGRLQPLAGAYRADSLRAALDRVGSPVGRPVRELVAELSVSTVRGLPEDSLTDVDTEADLDRLRRSLRPDRDGTDRTEG